MDFDVISPQTKDELIEAINNHQGKDFKIGAGYTDLINQLKNKNTEGLTIINISQVKEPEFNFIAEAEGYIEIGTLVTASDLINNELIQREFPVLFEAAQSVASIQIRNLATVGGNICNASPSGDMVAALVALESVCCIVNTNGEERKELLSHFIQGVRKTSLAKNEFLSAIHIPNNISTNIKSGFEKVGTRKSMEISIVSLAYHIQMDDKGEILHAGISCGAVAPTIPFAEKAGDFLVGKFIDGIYQKEKIEFAELILTYASPITDVRATEWYRKEVLSNLAVSILD